MEGHQVFWFFYLPGNWPLRYNTTWRIHLGCWLLTWLFYIQSCVYFSGVWRFQSLWWSSGLEFLLCIWRSFIPASRICFEERGGYSCGNTWPHKGIIVLGCYMDFFFSVGLLQAFEILWFNICFSISIKLGIGSHREGEHRLKLIEVSGPWWGWWNAEDGFCWRCWTYSWYVSACRET